MLRSIVAPVPPPPSPSPPTCSVAVPILPVASSNVRAIAAAAVGVPDITTVGRFLYPKP